jgi:hypothetical protein
MAAPRDHAALVARGIRLAEELIDRYPLVPAGTDSSEGRSRATEVEKTWTATLPAWIEIDGDLYDVIVPHDPRHWFDLAIRDRGSDAFYPYNVKAHKSATVTSAGNMGGFTWSINYLILHEFCKETLEIQTYREDKALSATLACVEQDSFDQTPRDYFIIDATHDGSWHRVFAFGCIADRDLVANPTNGFQVDGAKAKADIARTQQEVTDFIMDKWAAYLNKRRAGAVRMDKIMAAREARRAA